MTSAIGRASELSVIDRFLDDFPQSTGSLLIEGQPGIGKTTLWQYAIEKAKARSYQVLACSPAQTETKLSYAALDDMIHPILGDSVAALPDAQRHALQVAFLEAEAAGPPLEARAVMLGALGVVRMASQSAPLLIAVDDLQWLDASSARALSFISRRLSDSPIGILGTVRRVHAGEPEEPDAEKLPLDLGWGDRIELEGLDETSFAELLGGRLPSLLSRQALRQVYSMSSGNPLFGLELSRTLVRADIDYTGRMPSVPESIRGVLAQRLEYLAKSTRGVLRTVAALSRPSIELVTAACRSKEESIEALDEALAAGVLIETQPYLRFANPLLASVVYWQASPRERRELHRRLADVVRSPEERARHLALSTVGVDPEVAEALVAAATIARARGAPDAAAQLLEEAIRLTPSDLEDERLARCLEAGWCHFQAADHTRARALMQQVVDESSPGPLQAEALRRLGHVLYLFDSWDAARDCLKRALMEVGDDPHLRGPIELEYAMAVATHGDVEGALRHSKEALRQATATGSLERLGECTATVALMEFIRTGVFDRGGMDWAVSVEVWGPEPLAWVPSLARAVILKFADEFEEAAVRFEEAARRMRDSGHEGALPLLLVHWVQLECWAGHLEVAESLAAEALDVTGRSGMEPMRALALATAGLVAAYRGQETTVRAYAEEGMALGEQTGNLVAIGLSLTALGSLAVSQGDWAAAHRSLGPMTSPDETTVQADPSVLRFLADEIEGLIALDEVERADQLLRPFESRAADAGGVWSLAVSARCRALLEAARGNLESASQSIDVAIERLERLRMPLESGRTLLVKGVLERRTGRKRAARESIETARSIFDQMGASLWAQKARAELGRFSGKAAGRWQLTDAERRVADLAVAGSSNREIAVVLYISVRAVEQHLSNIYRKLGIRSRTELAITYLASSGRGSQA